MVKAGTLWTDTNKFFRVLSVTVVEDHTWVHYREDRGNKFPVVECKEYSCYQESFLSRFRQLPE